MQNKKSIIILIIILSVITLILIVLFILFLTKNNVLKKYFKFEFKNDSKIILDQRFDVKNLNVFTDYGSIKIKYSDDDKIRVVAYGENKNNVIITENEEILEVKNNQEKRNFIIFSFKYSSNDLIIYLPKNYEKDIVLTTEYGDVESINLAKSNLKINVDYGDIKLDAVKNITIISNYGNVKIDDVLGSLKIDMDYGNVEIKNLNIKKDSKIESNYGNIKIKNTNDIYINANTNLGDIKIKNSNRRANITLDISSDLGDIKVGY